MVGLNFLKNRILKVAVAFHPEGSGTNTNITPLVSVLISSYQSVDDSEAAYLRIIWRA